MSQLDGNDAGPKSSFNLCSSTSAPGSISPHIPITSTGGHTPHGQRVPSMQSSATALSPYPSAAESQYPQAQPQQYHQLQQLSYQAPFSSADYTGVPNNTNYESHHSRPSAPPPLTLPPAQNAYDMPPNYLSSRAEPSSALRQHLTAPQPNHPELANQCRQQPMDAAQQSQQQNRKPTDIQQSVSAQNPSFQIQQRSSVDRGTQQRQPNSQRSLHPAIGRDQRKDNEGPDMRAQHESNICDGRHYQQLAGEHGTFMVRDNQAPIQDSYQQNIGQRINLNQPPAQRIYVRQPPMEQSAMMHNPVIVQQQQQQQYRQQLQPQQAYIGPQRFYVNSETPTCGNALQELSEAPKEKYRELKRKFKFLIMENEYYQEELRNLQRKLLKLSRDKNFLLDRLTSYEDVGSPNDSESDDSEASAKTLEDRSIKSKRKTMKPIMTGSKKSLIYGKNGEGPSRRRSSATVKSPSKPKVEVPSGSSSQV